MAAAVSGAAVPALAGWSGYPLTGGRRAPPAVAELAAGLHLDQDCAYEVAVWLLQEASALDAAAQVDRLLWALRQGLPVEVAIGGDITKRR